MGPAAPAATDLFTNRSREVRATLRLSAPAFFHITPGARGRACVKYRMSHVFVYLHLAVRLLITLLIRWLSFH